MTRLGAVGFLLMLEHGVTGVHLVGVEPLQVPVVSDHDGAVVNAYLADLLQVLLGTLLLFAWVIVILLIGLSRERRSTTAKLDQTRGR
jgi:hypothetical protein